jgi:hypothetical protein
VFSVICSHLLLVIQWDQGRVELTSSRTLPSTAHELRLDNNPQSLNPSNRDLLLSVPGSDGD